MPFRIRALLTVAAFAGCSSSTPTVRTKGRIVVAVTIDWEGAYLSPEGLDAVDKLRKGLGQAPLTHFVSAAYFTKSNPDPTTAATIKSAILDGDELALHLHAWRSLAQASGIEPKVSPSFLTGTDKLLEFEDGDVGFDTDLDVYDVTELRALLSTSRRLLEQAHPVSKTFRAGGYLGTPKVLEAIREEGYTIDSSATDSRQLDKQQAFLPKRVKEIWPDVDMRTQPFVFDVAGGELVELPIAAIADYVTIAEIVDLFESAHVRLQKDPDRDVFVVLGFHQETAEDFGGRLGEAIADVRIQLANELFFTTIESAAALARNALVPAS